MPKLLGALLVGLLAPALAKGDAPGPVAPVAPVSAEDRDHWSFRPPSRPEVPAIADPGRARNPIDRFLLKSLDEHGLTPAPEAGRVALIRRVSADLAGLPPGPDDLAAFLADDSPGAYERLVDRLLASPRFGERWAQHWLDLAHYADTNGFEGDADRPDAWRYRDWVVDALNADMPYDQFARLQLAGDEARPGDPSALVATGFGRCGPREVATGGDVDKETLRQAELAEVAGTVGSVFLGMTIACARCHDHKFDPVPIADYYRFQAFFAGARPVDKPIATPEEEETFRAAKQVVDDRVAGLKGRLAAIEAPYRAAVVAAKKARWTPEEAAIFRKPEPERDAREAKIAEGLTLGLRISGPSLALAMADHPADVAARDALRREVDAAEKAMPRAPARAMALIESKPQAPATFILRRGELKNRGDRVEARPPGVLVASMGPGAFPGSIEASGSGSNRRLALADWLARPDNPLTARVIVNRLWLHHFGRGLVESPSDFGRNGEEPSHPELLDWLAAELVANGWHLKPIHRLIVTSAAYRRSGAADPRALAEDPDNALLGRRTRRRLDAEAVRDAMLAVAGEINLKAGGPGVRVALEPEVEATIFTSGEFVDLWPEDPDPAEHLRRSLYLFRKRNVRYPLLDAFDAPDTQSACPRRESSTHALQALALLNSDFAAARARGLAGRVLREAGPADAARVARAYRLVLAREPRADETERALAFLRDQAALLRVEAARPLARPAATPDGMDPAEAAAWVDFALAMLNRNEFLYVP